MLLPPQTPVKDTRCYMLRWWPATSSAVLCCSAPPSQLQDPGTDASEGGALPSELFILATAANQLFQSSYRMSSDALSSLLSALTHVSMGQLPQLQAAQQGAAAGGGSGASSGTTGTTRMAALSRMVEVMLANPDRLQVSRAKCLLSVQLSSYHGSEQVAGFNLLPHGRPHDGCYAG